jgi:uncharacterized protein DUF4238
MTAPRKHHTVPQCYLRPFADADGRLWEYEKGTGRATRKRVEEVATEHDFYTLERPDGTLDLVLEETLSKIEGVAVAALRRLIAGETPSPTDHGDIAYFMALQFVRTRSFRRGIAQRISGNIRGMNAFVAEDDAAFEATIERYERHVPPDAGAMSRGLLA